MSAAERLQQSQSPAPAPDSDPAPALPDELASAQTRAAAAAGASGAETASMLGKIARTRAALAAQPKVRIRCTMDTPVIINGYRIDIKGGETVMVPEQVADLLIEAGKA